jgi:lipid-binding SYLF domain-containing protein
MKSVRTLLIASFILSAAFLVFSAAFTKAVFAREAATREGERLRASGEVLKEILNIPDDIPKPLLDRAECVVVIPSVKKFAVGIGGSFGRGAMSCRTGKNFTGPWSAPALYALEGANIGLQLGGQATDFVLLVMNPKGAESLMKSKVKLGGDASAAAGPKGRDATAATDILMHAEILSYSRSRGLFAGVSLEGSTLRQDNSANKKVYGREVTAREITREGKVRTPADGALIVATLNHASPRNHSEAKSLKQ